MGEGAEHRYYEDLAVAHVLGGLDPDDGRLFRAHLLECSECRARVWELRSLAHDLADVERDERRERAAQTLETKQREDEATEVTEAEPSRPPRSRFARVGVAVGLVALAGLVAWTVMLRGTVERQEAVIAELQAANDVLEFGEPAETVRAADDAQGAVTVEGDRVVLRLRGLEDGSAYGVYLLDATGDVVHNRATLATDGRLDVLMELPEGTRRAVVTQLTDGPSPEPSGPRIYEAQLPRG